MPKTPIERDGVLQLEADFTAVVKALREVADRMHKRPDVPIVLHTGKAAFYLEYLVTWAGKLAGDVDGQVRLHDRINAGLKAARAVKKRKPKS